MTVEQERTDHASIIENEIAGGRLPTIRPAAPTDLLDKQRYLSREFADAELSKMWGRVWQIACMDSDIPNVGDCYEYKIGVESILVVRESQDAPGHSGVKAYHNVCQHRGRPLKQGSGNAEKLQCPYHGWTWNLDGSIRHIPERQEFCPFSDDAVALPAVKLDRWEQFYFVNLDPDAGSLLDYLGDPPGYWEGMRKFNAIGDTEDRLVRLAGDYFNVTSLNVATASGERAARAIMSMRDS